MANAQATLLVTLALVLLWSLGSVPAAGDTGSRVAERARQAAEFEALDPNGDGQIALFEMQPATRPWMRLADTSRDGALDLDEYVAFLDQPGGDFDAPLPENVELIADIPYAGTEHHRQQLDLLLPRVRETEGPLPVIVYVHGGGWSLGSRLMARPQVAPHVASGHYAAAAIGYRLSGEVSYPAPLHDLKAGIRWIRANASRHGLDASRICVMGASAGGHLTSLIATTNGSTEHAGSLGPHRSESSDVQCAIPLFGSTDLVRQAPQATGGSSRRDAFLGGGGEAVLAAARSASPILHVDPSDPPFYFIHGTKDRLVPYDHSVNLDRELRAAE
ncbi:MAG: alpha/beta hydrolase, partial [Deltaproteobacteria bacterium]|nr:alpha/beta hydrolase [Deltaproteobacteria bacterium]